MNLNLSFLSILRRNKKWWYWIMMKWFVLMEFYVVNKPTSKWKQIKQVNVCKFKLYFHIQKLRINIHEIKNQINELWSQIHEFKNSQHIAIRQLKYLLEIKCRSKKHPFAMFYQIAVFKTFPKFLGKCLCQSLFFKNLQPYTMQPS